LCPPNPNEFEIAEIQRESIIAVPIMMDCGGFGY